MSVLDEIAAERRRQVEDKGWTPEHDDTHTAEELAEAAACYAVLKPIYYGQTPQAPFMQRPRQGQNRELHGPYLQVELVWPWKEPINESKDHRRDLIKAAALIVAAIERSDRKRKKYYEFR